MQKGIKNQSKIYAKSMQEKGMQKVWKMMTKGSQNGNRNPSKIEKVMEKRHAKKQRRNLRPKKSDLHEFPRWLGSIFGGAGEGGKLKPASTS